MRPDQKTQIRAVVSTAQAAALSRVAKQRGISKMALIREGIEAVTGVAPGIRAFPPNEPCGFTRSSHPSFRGKRKEASA